MATPLSVHTYVEICKVRTDLQILGMKLQSAAAAQYFANQSVDAVFVDADHSYDGVARDITAWLPKIKPGGVLCGHDFHSVHWPGVVRAVQELVPIAKPVNVGTIWMLSVV